MSTQTNIPKLQDLISDTDMAMRRDQLQVLLNQDPPESWFSPHPTATVDKIGPNGTKTKAPALYMPIERVEWLLTRLFGRWRVEVLESKLVANSVCVTVRIHYLYPVTGEWCWVDGIGAAPLQTDKGAGATEFDKIKSAAVQMSAPAAKSFAIKDASEHLGKLFGRDINRKGVMNYMAVMEKWAESKTPADTRSEILELMSSREFNLSETVMKNINRVLDSEEEESYVKVLKTLKGNLKTQ